jgi:hypothetical protein
MKRVFAICLLALSNLSHALNLQLTFNETSFGINTSGTFTLQGEIPMWGIGWSGPGFPIGLNDGDGSGITSYTFGTQYRGGNTANLPDNYYFTLDSYDATGTAIRDGLTHPILPGTRALWVQIFNKQPTLQVYVGPEPKATMNNPFASAFVDISGTFGVNSSVNSGQTPASQGISFDNLAGTFNSGEYDPAGSFTITVPEPSTLSLLSLSIAPLFFRRRKSS